MEAYKGVAKRRNLLKAIKGFDKRLRCRGFQYEVGKEYQEPVAELCLKGFHACENPLDTFRYYPPTDSRYCEVEIDDNGQRNSENSKVCGEKIKIVSEIGLDGVIKAGAQFIFELCKGSAEDHASGERGNAAASGVRGNAAASGWSGNAAASGERGNAAASGWSGNAAASGWRGNAAASGWSGNAAASGVSGNAAASGERGTAAASGVRGTATATGRDGRASALGEQCIAVAWGNNSLAKGALGNWIVVSERASYGIVDAKLARVDGEIIKADTWYTLRRGEIVEVEE
uniref:DUF7666 domain-containing protein n=1 Tax=Phage sp. ctcqm2 TaxID=2828007 RepID=A0A8S5SUB2_9VIRU|nr:MAG TPA: hypothetical protein [Phage sp. ctcqm2]